MRRLKHWLRHEWQVELLEYQFFSGEVEHVICKYPGCGVRRLRDPKSGILFGPNL